MEYCRISISEFRRDQIVEKTQRIEHRDLHVGYRWGTGKGVWIPKGKCSVGLNGVIDESFPWPELENEVGTVELSP
jgi:hypothetical protein